ncbi:hypothetical protein ACIB24_06380 [Spongisporangium articulatum]|uniref:Integral membrane protein n=1 Tax=Spongisporangium articulatum TaxID=3362603 RepID=A0ABW8AKZ8_9ACTN
MPEPEAGVPAGDAAVSVALRRVVAALVVLEALLLLAGVVALALSADSANVVVMIVVGLALAGGLAAAAVGALQGRRWARGPILTWQLVQGGIALSVVFSPTWWVGVPLLAISVVTAVLVAGGRVIAREPGL